MHILYVNSYSYSKMQPFEGYWFIKLLIWREAMALRGISVNEFFSLCYALCLQLRNNALRIKHRCQRYSECSTFSYKFYIKLKFVQRTLTVSIYCAIVKAMHMITEWLRNWVKYEYRYYHRDWTGLLNASNLCQGMNYNHIVQQPYSYTCQYNN